MAKLTVYIPDDLLDRARATDPDANTSHLVQRGLERLSPSVDAAYARRPADARQLLEAAAVKVREGAAAEYEKGYRAALVMIGEADPVIWQGLADLAESDFDLMPWARSWTSGLGAVAAGLVPGAEAGFKPPDWYLPFLNDLGALLDPIGFDQWSFRRSVPFLRGYATALRDAWHAGTVTAHADVGDEPDQHDDEGQVGPASAPVTDGRCG